MSTTRQYELVYIVTPEASEQEIADLHTQIEQIVQRFNGTFDKTENWGREAPRLRHRSPSRRHLRGRDHHRLGRADEGNRSPPAGDRPGHPPPHRPRRRGAAGGAADAPKHARSSPRAGGLRAGLPPERQPGEGRGDGDSQDDMEGLEVQR